MRDIFLFFVTAYCSVVALKRPVFGMLAYVCFSLLAPYSLTWGPARTFPHVLIIGLCSIAGFFLSSESKNRPHQRELIFLFALWVIFGFSTLLGFHSAEAVPFFLSVSKSLLMVFIALVLINDEERVRLLARVVALSIGFHAYKIGLFVIRTGGQGAVFGPDNSYLEANNSLGMALAMNVPFLFYVAKTDSVLWVRGIAYTMLAFSYPAVIGTFSRGAWLGLATATGLLVLKSKNRILSLVAAGVLAISSPLWISYLTSEQISQRYDTLKNYEEDGSATSRFWNWTFCSRVGLANPLTGAGFNFYSSEAYAIYYPEFLEIYPDKVWSCHNTWLSMFAEHGLPGLFLWISLLGSTFLSLRRLKARQGNQGREGWLIDFSHMIQIGLISYAVSSTFIDVAYYEGLYFVLVIAIAMKEIAQRSDEQASTPLLTDVKSSRRSKMT